MTTLYIAGPMSGIEDYNLPAFDDAEYRLREHGYSVISPAEGHTELPGMVPWCEYLRRDLIELLRDADGVATLTGWKGSAGAAFEVSVATRLEIECKSVDGVLLIVIGTVW